jgi:hypothetical protein
MSREQSTRVDVDAKSYEAIRKNAERVLGRPLNDLTPAIISEIRKRDPQLADDLHDEWRRQSYR